MASPLAADVVTVAAEYFVQHLLLEAPGSGRETEACTRAFRDLVEAWARREIPNFDTASLRLTAQTERSLPLPPEDKAKTSVLDFEMP